MANTAQITVTEELAPVVEIADHELDAIAAAGEFGSVPRQPRA
ncbi:hypothetical protein [Amycolatopsis benzoatilytica]|nr:hypothetical protein [Amycolatopsis benzoatilytica]